MAKQLAPVVKRMRALGRDTRNTIGEFMGLAKGIDALDANSEAFDQDIDHLQQAMARVSQGWTEMLIDIQVLRAKKMEVGSLPDLAERMADTVMILEQVDELIDVDYIHWARSSLQLSPELLDVAVREVASYEGGGRKLELLRAAIDRLLEEVNTAAA